jgi:tRNA threonylcarbamoyladenosine biosynthesis protein TsaB
VSELVLGIDTIGRGGSVALADESGVIGIQTHDPELGYAEELFGLFDTLLRGCEYERRQLTAVAVLSGPGSFTGLRIGVMTAKTIAFGMGLPLLAAPTLHVVAAAAGPGRWIAAADAGGQMLWAASFEVDATGVHAQGKVRRLAPDEIEGEVVSAAPLRIGRQVDGLAGHLAALAARRHPPVSEVDPLALVPEYAAVSQAERVHGLDLSDELRRPIEPRGWPS